MAAFAGIFVQPLSYLDATLSDAQILTLTELLSSIPTFPRQGEEHNISPAQIQCRTVLPARASKLWQSHQRYVNNSNATRLMPTITWCARGTLPPADCWSLFSIRFWGKVKSSSTTIFHFRSAFVRSISDSQRASLQKHAMLFPSNFPARNSMCCCIPASDTARP